MQHDIVIWEAKNGYVLQVPFDWFKSHKPFIVKDAETLGHAVITILKARATGSTVAPDIPVALK